MTIAHDPVFAAVERHRSALAALHNAIELASEAKVRAEKLNGPCPTTLIWWRSHFIGGSEIDQRRAALIQAGEPAETVDREYNAAKAKEAAAVEAERLWHDRAGLSALIAAEQAAEVALDNARSVLAVTPPATAKGAAAVIAYILDGMDADEADELREYEKQALRSVARALQTCEAGR